jgi:hypothetical protein
MAQQQVLTFPQPLVSVVRPPRELLSYVLLMLLDETTDRVHRSYHSAICEAELGTMHFRGSGHYMRLHLGWCMKYVIRYIGFSVFPHLIS